MLKQNQVKIGPRLSARTTPHRVVFHILAVLVFGCTLISAVGAQSLNTAPGPKTGSTSSPETNVIVAQNQETTASVLNTARAQGSPLMAIIRFPNPVLPWTLQYRLGPGQIVAVYFRSLTSDWTGVSYSTGAPITDLSATVERFVRNHRQANPNDTQSQFGIEAIAVKATADALDQWLALFPESKLAYAHGASDSTASQSQTRSGAGTFDAYIPVQNNPTTKANNLLTSQSQTLAAATTAPFLPTSATLSIDARMISGTFSWSSDSALAGLKTLLSTLEIQTLFWSYAAKGQPQSTLVGNEIDFGASWSSAYYDTPIFDNLDFEGNFHKRNYTVGASDAARAFKPNTQYNFWIAAKPGDLAADLVEFSAQKGTYIPLNVGPGGIDACVLKPSFCVWPIFGSTDWFSPSVPYGVGARQFSIVAPTVFPFTYPNPICDIPPGQPELSTNLLNLSAADGVKLSNQMAAVQKMFKDGGGKPSVGCATTRLHEDTTWWPRKGKTQDFDGSQAGKGKGAILLAPDASQAYWIHGAIWTRYSSTQFGGPKSVVGEPIGNEQTITSSKGSTGAYQPFQRGFLYFNGSKNQTFYIANGIAQKYQALGLHADQLGFPVSDEYPWNGGARSDFEGGYIYWTSSAGAAIVRYLAPTVGSYSWTMSPKANQNFGGTISGTNFLVGGTQVSFCLSGSNTCYQQPAALITVNNPNLLTISNVNLASGSWQIAIQTAGGVSARSAPFSVQAVLPTINGYSWNTSPKANQSFGGTITGTNFVSGATQVFFCSSACYQQPAALVTVNNSNTLTVSNVNLAGGSWQVFVQTSAGSSARSSTFTVLMAAPTVTNYSWNTTPRANQVFGGTVSGTNFVSGNTQVFFCLGGTNTCYQQPSAGVSVNSSTSLSVSNVNLGSGAWQFYVQTSAGQSARSTLFPVLLGPPTIAWYSWNSTPVGTQPFSGTIGGTNFVAGSTQVFFCVSGSGPCYQQPSSGVTVSGTASLSVTNVRLSKGSWQIYLQTSAGQSGRSSTFSVR